MERGLRLEGMRGPDISNDGRLVYVIAVSVSPDERAWYGMSEGQMLIYAGPIQRARLQSEAGADVAMSEFERRRWLSKS